jgi:Lar family restriction alleviation protein
MTKGEKFKTAEERGKMLNAYCHSQLCADCELNKFNERQESSCYFHWLELEHKEELMPCPFCGGEAMNRKVNRVYYVFCTNCYVKTVDSITPDKAIAAWNRRVS